MEQNTNEEIKICKMIYFKNANKDEGYLQKINFNNLRSLQTIIIAIFLINVLVINISSAQIL